MTPERYKELETTDVKLTQQEINEGWHYCTEWDGMLCHPNMPEAEVCGCPIKIKLALKKETGHELLEPANQYCKHCGDAMFVKELSSKQCRGEKKC